MPVMDEFREEREKIKTASPKAKWKYFKDYYLAWVLIGLGIVVVAVAFLHSVLTQKEEVLYVSLVNFVEKDAAEAAVDDFAARYVEDPAHQKVVVDTSSFIVAGGLIDGEEGADASADGASASVVGVVTSEGADASVIGADASADGQDGAQGGAADAETLEEDGDFSIVDAIKYSYEDEQKVSTLAIIGEMDLMVTGEDVFRKYIAQGYFTTLDAVLGSEEIQAYADAGRVLYYDGVPAGIRMDDAPRLAACYSYEGEGEVALYAGFIAGSGHPEMAAAFLKYLDGE